MSATDRAPKAAPAAETPRELRVGRGNVLPVSGTLPAAPGARRGRPWRGRLTVRVGDAVAGALVQGVAPPGERSAVGGGWWQALVPIAPVEVPVREEILVELDGVGAGAGVSAGVGGQVLLEPGMAPQRAGDPGSRLVAVCMATCDPPPGLLRAQIESLRAQSHADWICLIADDASAPAGRAEIERLIAGDERFRLLAGAARLGFYRTFERALDAVPPDAAYVALCDQDDRWHPGKLASLIEALGPADVLAHSDARVVDAGGEVLADTFWPGARPEASFSELLYANAVSGAAALFRASLLDHALPLPALPGRAFHDRWIALVSAALGGIAYVERPLYDYVQHPGAAHGHARAVGAGAAADGGGGAGVLARAARRLRSGAPPNWRAAHQEVLARSVGEAIVLRLRVGERLTPAERGALARIEALPHSPAAQAHLLARHARRRARSRPGIEGALARGVAWGRLAPVRARAQGLGLGKLRQRSAAGAPAWRGAGSGGGGRGGGARIGIVLTEDRADAGYGDYEVAHGLGEALERLGAEVAYLEAGARGWPRAAGSLDALVSLLDRFPVDRAPAGVTAVAWIRNWTERWLERPWFRRYDLVLVSSRRSCELIAKRSSAEPALFPLATDPERFGPRPRDERLACDLLFAGSRWGVERDVERVLPALAADGFRVRVLGRGWDEVPTMAALCDGALDPAELAGAYSSANLVVDDSALHARPYGAVNARVFDALACGALVATNDTQGAAELFGGRLPTWQDADSLREHAAAARDDPERAGGRAGELRAEVLAAHTYEHRARELLALLGW